VGLKFLGISVIILRYEQRMICDDEFRQCDGLLSSYLRHSKSYFIMKRIIKKAIVSTLVIFFVMISGLITIMLFPQPLFAHKMEYKKFRVYSDNALDKNIEVVLNNAYRLVEQSELQDENYQYDIFFSHDNIYNRIEDLQGKGPAARATAGNIVFKVRLDIAANRAYGIISTINLTEILAHEMVHCLQANKLGLWNMNQLNHPPYWKLEGYPEYISRQAKLKAKDYSLTNEVKRFIELNSKSKDGIVEVSEEHFMPSVYYKGRLMVEYLMDVKRMTYAEILRDTRTEDEVFQEMVHSTLNLKPRTLRSIPPTLNIRILRSALLNSF
jgi:hypothetical protein